MLALRLLLLATASLFFAIASSAAPAPLSPTSLFFSIEKEMYRSPLGFSIHAGRSKWTRVEPPKNNEYLNAIFRSPEENSAVQAALTVRSDAIEKKMSLAAYVKQWMKDYPRFGFQILNAKKVQVGERDGYLIDMVNRDAKKQLRQVLFMRDLNVVTLTCRDDMAGFPDSLRSCNEIIRTFRW